MSRRQDLLDLLFADVIPFHSSFSDFISP